MSKLLDNHNNLILAELTLSEEESLCGGGIWDKVKKVWKKVKKTLPAAATAGAVAGLALLTGGQIGGGSDRDAAQLSDDYASSDTGMYWGGGTWKN